MGVTDTGHTLHYCCCWSSYLTIRAVINFKMSVSIPTIRLARSFATAVVKPHVPMIKFRKGQQEVSHTSTATPAPAAPGVYEWWEVPSKYRRGNIDQCECDVINMGGGDKLW